MSIKDQNNALTVDGVRQKLEDYITTIQALQSCVGVLTWDAQAEQRLQGSQDSLGRRMSTSPTNRIAPSITITPDAAVQRDEWIGYIVEAKKSLPANQRYWQKLVEQLEKYDDDLTGWWTDNEKISSSCVVLLLEISRVSDFCQYLDDLRAKNELAVEKPISVVEFARTPEIKEFIWLRTHWGQIEDESVARSLKSGLKVPIENVISANGELKFYDSKPITEHTMYILWQDIFTEMKSETEYNEDERAWLLEANINELTEELQRLYGSTGSEHRDVRFPKTKCVRDAMEALVRLDLAKRVENGQHYTVYFRRITGDLIERFAKHRTPVSQVPEATQLKLFETGDNEEQ